MLAGIAAGTVNAIVGSGSLITFPVLLFLGYPPLVANVSNTIGLAPGSAAGAYGYRRELIGQRTRVVRLALAGAVGSLLGAALLLSLPPSLFGQIVPVLILGATSLVAVQPSLSRWLAARRTTERNVSVDSGGPLLAAGVVGAGIYGGYFGAALGIVLMALFGLGIGDDIQRLNGLKNSVAAAINTTAALVFLAVAPFDPRVVVALAIGATIGGLLGSSVGRRLSPTSLRAAILVVGLIASLKFLVG
jgi:uncharacterized protein